MQLLLLLLVLNIFFFNSGVLGLILGVIFFGVMGKRFGKWLFPDEDAFLQTIIGIFFVLSYISFVGAIIYYFYQLNNWAVAILLFSIPIIIYKLNKKWPQKQTNKFIVFFQKITFLILNRNKLKIFFKSKLFLLKIAYLSLIGACYYFLFTSSTTNAIRSPWLVVLKWFFLCYFLASLLLIIIVRQKKSKFPLFFLSIHSFLSISIALVVYRLGYGFDPFIHQATEKFIMQNGFISPKPLYYLGQYSLVITLAKIFQANVLNIDKFLVPILFAAVIPLVIYFSFIKSFNWERKNALIATISFLLLPYSLFIATTPQALANIYAIIIIFLSLVYLRSQNNKLLASLFFLSFTTVAIHPLTGIPAIIFISLIYVFTREIKRKKIILFVLAIVSSIILPIIFLFNSFLSNISKIKINFDFSKINFLKINLFTEPRQYHLIKDFIYFYGFNIILIFLLVSLAGIVIWHKKKIKIYFPYVLTFFILIANYIIIEKFVVFESLIFYEQNSYSQRILSLSLYFLLPFFMSVIYYFFQKLDYSSQSITRSEIQTAYHRKEPLFSEKKIAESLRFLWDSYDKIFFIIFFALWLSASLYLSYPRYDNYVSGKGYNVSEADFNAVQFINKNAKSNYIVLANQNTSAAALAKYGFKRYYKDIFYYPIPTSSPLYKFYLDMVNVKPSRSVMVKAMNLAGVKEGYFVISDYWWQAGQIIERAKLEADDWDKIDNGKIYVFKYLY